MDKEQALEKHGKVYESGTVLFREGEAGSKLWVINEGKVRLSKRVCEEEIVLETLGPGEFCGELALVMEEVQPVTATVEEPARLLIVDAKQFETMVRSNGELAMRMLRKLAGRLTEAQYRVSALHLRSALGRIMLQLRWELTVEGVKRAAVPGDLGDFLGLDAAEVKLSLDKLIAKNLIEIDKDNTFSIVDETEFRRYLKFLELSDRYEFFNK
ncbi:MAG: Crp/Fnr family transcriptional regulator [Proteobacteria bacterium]|nr:Crp/Fnr family transcriptional regulator [Pseudomonadota bacterium]